MTQNCLPLSLVLLVRSVQPLGQLGASACLEPGAAEESNHDYLEIQEVPICKALGRSGQGGEIKG